MADEDVPPLDDMSDLLHQVEALRDNRSSQPTRPPGRIPVNGTRNYNNCTLAQDRYSNVARNYDQATLAEPPGSPSALGATGYTQPHNQNNAPVNNLSAAAQGATAKPRNTFGDLKSGFLLNKTSQPCKNDKRTNETRNLTEANLATSKKTYNKDMPFIKPKVGADIGLQLPEVQEALEASDSLLQNKDAWLTDDLLAKVKNDDFMHRCLSDPAYVRAITEMQTNPQAAMQRHQNNPDMQRFLRDFKALMGDHFTSLGNSTQGTKSQNAGANAQSTRHRENGAERHRDSAGSDVNSNQSQKAINTADDTRKMQDLFSDPEVMQILKDPRIQKLFEALRTHPEQGQRMLQTADADMRHKIQKLVDVGMLGFEI